MELSANGPVSHRRPHRRGFCRHGIRGGGCVPVRGPDLHRRLQAAAERFQQHEFPNELPRAADQLGGPELRSLQYL